MIFLATAVYWNRFGCDPMFSLSQAMFTSAILTGSSCITTHDVVFKNSCHDSDHFLRCSSFRIFPVDKDMR